MSIELIKQLRDAADALEASMQPAPSKPPRVISIMAKNVQYGDHVNFPNIGWKEVNGHTHYGDSDDTVLSAVGAGGAIHTFPGHKRVQVRRYV